ncbi:transporter [Flavobacterium antarcticum]|uniref:transporter n=1 Tax=Flavobacterium antarcticum TaxID=271155 RepID=UPI0003B689DD|nr:transporter [Flavobacterium antarcticum]
MTNLLKNALLLLPFLTVCSANAQYTDVINSNRPGESQAAFSVGQTVFQAETGFYGTREEHSLLGTKTNGFGVDLALRYGAFLEQLEFNIELKHQWDQFQTGLGTENRGDFKKITVGAKYLIYDPFKNYEEKVNILSWKANHRFKWRQFIPAVGVYAGANLNFNSIYLPENEASISPKLMVITQNQFSGGYVFVTNIIADRVTSEFPSYGYIVTLTKGFNEKWSGFIENQGFKSDFYSDSVLRAGAAYLIKENIQVDASIGGNFKDTPSILVGGIGLSWRFDKNYKPILIRSGKEDGKDKDKKDKKDKKKRKDEVETIEVEKP